jgi:hypothetical protein
MTRTPVTCGRGRALRAAAAGSGATVTAVLLRKRLLWWGSSPEEIGAALPGDDLLSRADMTATRAITIDSDAATVWPWLIQIGQGRGGFYSYDVLENLIGCDIHSTNEIVTEWQHLNVGDQVRLHPTIALTVAQVDPGRALVLRGGVPIGKTQAPFDFTWAFVVTTASGATSRLVVRERYRYLKRWAALIVEPTGLVSFVMTQRMLHGIARRAERTMRLAPPNARIGRTDRIPVNGGRVE